VAIRVNIVIILCDLERQQTRARRTLRPLHNLSMHPDRRPGTKFEIFDSKTTQLEELIKQQHSLCKAQNFYTFPKTTVADKNARVFPENSWVLSQGAKKVSKNWGLCPKNRPVIRISFWDEVFERLGGKCSVMVSTKPSQSSREEYHVKSLPNAKPIRRWGNPRIQL
jgi:hypothetical protein